MMEYVKLLHSQLDKLKAEAKNAAGVLTLALSIDMIGTDENNCPCNLLLTDRQVASLRKTFANSSSKGVKSSKTQIHKLIQSSRFLGRLLGPLLKVGLPLMKNVLQTLAKSLLIPLELTAAALAADAELHKKI